jgi:hypothetical protein
MLEVYVYYAAAWMWLIDWLIDWFLVFNAAFNNISAMYVNYYCLSMFIYQSNRSDYIAVIYQIKQQWDWTKSYHNKKYRYNNDNKSSTYINIINI